MKSWHPDPHAPRGRIAVVAGATREEKRAVHPFAGYQAALTWVRADPVEGNWYRAEDTGEEGWLCPALFCYLPVPPPKIYVRVEPRQKESGRTSRCT